ncbi:MAG TPA: hypothetical protein IAA26_01210 [Candidatus Blautia faecipullorum]|nr:hypothetical protein [Candidatus Blautia faecipullorum]
MSCLRDAAYQHQADLYRIVRNWQEAAGETESTGKNFGKKLKKVLDRIWKM